MSVTSKLKLLAKLRSKEYRDAYVEEKVATSLPFQIRELREQRDWSQAELGHRADMRQNAVSRLEDAESGTPSINTLLRLARAFDVALLVKFVPFTKLLSEFSDVSSEALMAASFDEELPQLERAVARAGWQTFHTELFSDVFGIANMATGQIYLNERSIAGHDFGHIALTANRQRMPSQIEGDIQIGHPASTGSIAFPRMVNTNVIDYSERRAS